MTHAEQLLAHLRAVPLIAILRGVKPDEAVAVAGAVVDAGFTVVEVPLNSPDPFTSVERVAQALGARATVGAGTVLDPADVARVRDAGGTVIVSPDGNPDVVRATVAAGLASAPGFFTATEAFALIRAGATVLKLFPAEAVQPKVVGAMRAVLPKSMPLLAVGGITPDGMAAWRAAGADGFGLGSALYKPGMSAAEVGRNARAFMDHLKD